MTLVWKRKSGKRRAPALILQRYSVAPELSAANMQNENHIFIGT
jgi:hypothetical protein